MNFATPRYAAPRPAKTDRNWQVYAARHVDRLTFTQLVDRFQVNRKRIGDILAWCDRQAALGRRPS